MTSRGPSCGLAEEALDLAAQGAAPSAGQAAHAQSCAACAEAWARGRGLAGLTARFREALAQADGLSPAAWARVRAAAERAKPRTRPRWVALAAVAAALGLVTWVVLAPERSRQFGEMPAGVRGLATEAAPGVDGAGERLLPGRAAPKATEVARGLPVGPNADAPEVVRGVPAGREGAGEPEAGAAANASREPTAGAASAATDPGHGSTDGATTVLVRGPTDGVEASVAWDSVRELGAGGADARSVGAIPLVLKPGEILATEANVARYRVGSHVLELTSQTRLKVLESQAGVWLELLSGEARFDVRRAPGDGPFRVQVSDLSVEVRGTLWSIAREDDIVRVSVNRGAVAVLRPGQPEVALRAGQSQHFDLASRPPQAPRRGPEQPSRVVEIDAGHQRAKVPGGASDHDHLVPPILAAVRAGRCDQALAALEHLRVAAQGRVSREALWLTAWCTRKGGDLQGSRALFQRYGTGPWPVPVGDELPRLPQR